MVTEVKVQISQWQRGFGILFISYFAVEEAKCVYRCVFPKTWGLKPLSNLIRKKIRLTGQVSIVQTTWVCSGNTALDITLPLITCVCNWLLTPSLMLDAFIKVWCMFKKENGKTGHGGSVYWNKEAIWTYWKEEEEDFVMTKSLNVRGKINPK